MSAVRQALLTHYTRLGRMAVHYELSVLGRSDQHFQIQISCIGVLDICAGGGPHQGMSYDSIVGDNGYAYFLPSISFTVATTRSGSNPNLFCSSLSGAEAPNVSMPMTRPASPTYRSHPKVEACSMARRAFTPGGKTLSRYSFDWCSKMSHEGIETTRERISSATNFSCAWTARLTSLPEAMRITSGFLPRASASTYAPLATPAAEAYFVRSNVGNGCRDNTRIAGSWR